MQFNDDEIQYGADSRWRRNHATLLLNIERRFQSQIVCLFRFKRCQTDF